MNIRRAEHSRAVHVLLEARGRSRAETLDVHIDKLTGLSL